MFEDIREIWFRCNKCGRESYCGKEFDQLQRPEVLCPFCRNLMQLDEVRLTPRLGYPAPQRPPGPPQM